MRSTLYMRHNILYIALAMMIACVTACSNIAEASKLPTPRHTLSQSSTRFTPQNIPGTGYSPESMYLSVKLGPMLRSRPYTASD